MLQTSPAKILIGSPIRQHPRILTEFIKGLQNLDTTGLEISFCFVDDCENTELTDTLEKLPLDPVHIITPANGLKETYICDEQTHHWAGKDSLVWRVASHKNILIQEALNGTFDYLFLVDSDIILDPRTLHHLVQQQEDPGNEGVRIYSSTFWTKWEPHLSELPQVWESGQYNLSPEFIEKLKIPGIYEVGGLGACTLISRSVLEAGVTFNQVSNLDLWGEDRHFCHSARQMGFKLYADTTLQQKHIYRLSDLPQKILLSILVRNEADRYLKEVLEHAKQYVDEIMVLDDGSTDRTVELCRSTLAGYPRTIHLSAQSSFSRESELRKRQWNLAQQSDADWILVLDADEILEGRIITEIRELVKETNYDAVAFRLYDMWDKIHYREDPYWEAHKHFRPFLVRASAVKDPAFADQNLHCGRLPLAVNSLPTRLSSIRLKHYGWAKVADRDEKYWRYKTLDPDAKYGIQAQYDSIKDKNPKLKRFDPLPGLSLCMIVKNEEKYLQDCLDSARGLVNEIIIVDTGSTDSTVKIAKRNGAKVFNFAWINDFSAARNYALEQAHHQWILVLDADETLDRGSHTIIKEAIKSERKFIYSATVVNELVNKTTEHLTARLFPNSDLIRYKNVIHEQPVDQLNEVTDLPLTAFVIYHKGYHADMVISRQKNKRNLDLLQKRIFDNLLDPLPRMSVAQELEGVGNIFEAVDQLRIGLHLCRLMNSPPALLEQIASDLVNLGARHENHNLAYHEAKMFLLTYPNPTHPGFWIGYAESQLKMNDGGAKDSWQKAVKYGNTPIVYGSLEEIKTRAEKLKAQLLQPV